ncbi:RNase3 domain-containing protein [Pseudomassariella vexata]|uniref:Dicer-like protein 1 n=1 Tax=Pseudomassariella vexata TaxID=1141098 RepID=A0A1Y2DUC0_9PEZI|nr:RNase3 domain-containing protein [Pseudomassariella vexata]ORY62880.1 RNase3 domain-containing protein [Pseudomassariella vexata]
MADEYKVASDDDDPSLNSEKDRHSDDEPGNPAKNEAKPRKVTERRRADISHFHQWARDEQLRRNRSALSAATSGSRSASWLDTVNTAHNRIIDSPREYQVELLERAKEKNIIAVLATGSGKTLIAAMLIRHIIEQELVDRDAKRTPRICFFLVDKVSLVLQQHKVLKDNLDHNVSMLHGDFAGAISTHSYWRQQLDGNMAIVCTAAILLNCLHYSYITMDQINLLIFDEAHHTKKNHPYARIIKDFYAKVEEDGHRRPRIFGMTASPIDAKTDLATAAAQLEGLLQSEIATVADPSIMKQKRILDTRVEELVEYGLAPFTFETALWQRLNALVGENKAFTKLFTFSKECTRDLGRWCSDRMWQLCLTPEEILKIKARAERDLMGSNVERPMAFIDATTTAIQDAHEVILNHSLAEPQLTYEYLSHKVISLIGIFRKHFNPFTDKCIVFVEQRLTANLLADLLKHPSLGLSFVKPGALVGSGNGETGEQLGMSYKHQLLAVKQFRDGELNCLLATSIAEEGLDIPDCNMIIRFDLYNTMIQYIQSKGRARKKDSKYFHMVEIGNQENIQRVLDNQEKEDRLRDFCLALPEDRQLRGNDFDMDYFLSKEKSHRAYVIPSTGAKLTYKISISVLASFVASLECPPDVYPLAEYVVKSVGSEFQGEVILPDGAPIKSALGRRAGSKQIAKCSAAFEMCLKLRKEKAIDEHLQSTFKKWLPTMRNAHLAISSKKKTEYNMRIKPDIWSHRGFPETLFVAVLKLLSPAALGQSSRPLAILTRKPLPRLNRFPLFFGNHSSSLTECVSLSSTMATSADDVREFTEFTLRMFKDVFSKEYKSEPEKLPYYIAPVQKEHEFDLECIDDARPLLDWECLHMLRKTGDLNWEGQSDDIWKDRFVTDPHDGSRKFYTFGRKEGIQPTDPQVPGACRTNGKRKKGGNNMPDDIWNYSVSLWANSRARIQRRDDLPVVEAQFIPLRRNLLDDFEKTVKQENQCYLVFETLRISALPIEYVAMAYNLPAIMYRLESNLIALDACKELGLDIRADLALEAMTKDSDSTEEYAEEQANLQKATGHNYERLEFLGDSFLKLSTTISLFSQVPEGDEFRYHVDRMVLVCNRNLFNQALELKIEEYIRSKSFDRRNWYPDGLELLKGKKNTSILGKKGAGKGFHTLGDKSIADVCEALIGAAYLSTYKRDQSDFNLAIKAVTKFVKHKYHTMTTYEEFYKSYNVPAWQVAEPTAVHLNLAKKMEERLGYKFAHPRLLRSAFTHPSYSSTYEHIPHYQRLEFLGDALLDMVCVDFLFHRYLGADPQWLTEHKMAMVSNQFLGCLCVSLGLHRHLVHMSGALPHEISAYVTSITEAREHAEHEAESNKQDRAAYARNFWVEAPKPPKCLPDIIESYIGAVFVDSKYDYSQVQRFFDAEIVPYFENIHLYDTYAKNHPVTFLTNVLQLRYHCANWRLLIEETVGGAFGSGISVTDTEVICGVMVHGQVREHAIAASGRHAKIDAAKKLVASLDGVKLHEFKEKFQCDCTYEDAEKADLLVHGTAI